MEGSAYEFFSPMGSRGMLRGPNEVEGVVWWIPLENRVGLMSLLMIHEAYMPVYKGSKFSLHASGAIRGSTIGPLGPKKCFETSHLFLSQAQAALLRRIKCQMKFDQINVRKFQILYSW